ncbi:hypothetical protein MM239_14945 [Belliella sp. DSM 111904]|uniref:Uncharacterized protein n=1 Tax=Belliella filtrata TaxID=2923435 RepID=A0ABS9V2S2_9BACT|nr:hypothetical protein [Belliella filtrata]MCH7410703.1 hypothetical protein [Belliella filtrata]
MRWFGVDPQDQFASPYLAMGNNPMMMIDPDGELAGLVLGAMAAGATQSALFYASSLTAGNSWDWGQFASQIGKGALTGGLTAGASYTFAAGLNAAGLGINASYFMGGTLGSFSGSAFSGGIPNETLSLGSVGLGAVMGGWRMQRRNNPAKISSIYEPEPNEVDILLGEVLVVGKQMKIPWLWGKTNDLLNELWVTKGGQMFIANNLPLSTGAINPNYSIESLVIGGMATSGVLKGR